MKILIVANHKTGNFATFITEQVNALKKLGLVFDFFGVEGKGFSGYLFSLPSLKKKIDEFKPDLIHAHYGLSGLLANLQRTVPVVTTYHGSDIHSGGWILKLSQLAMWLSSYNIFVSKKIYKQSDYHKKNISIISCGVDLETIKPIGRKEAKDRIGIKNTIVLFAGSFTNQVKNPELAQKSMSTISQAELIELRGYSREEVSLLMNAADCLLVTSHREAGPLVVKEAMACGTPIVSVDVGDVREIIGETAGCYIAERNTLDIAKKVELALTFHGKTEGRRRIIDLGLDNDCIAKKIIKIYQQVI